MASTVPRKRHGARKRCSDPNNIGCTGFARRNSEPLACHECGGGTRAEIKHFEDGSRLERGQVIVSGRVQMLLNGTLSVDDLDDEELARGYPKAKDGTFRGVPPKVIPRAMHNAIRKKLFERAAEKLQMDLLDTVTYMGEVVRNTQIDPKTRLDAAKWIVERIMGKNPDRVEFSADKPFMELLEDIHRGPAPKAIEATIVDAEIVEDPRL